MKKTRKKTAVKPRTKYPFSETAWKDYTAALVKWKLAYELWQKSGKEAMEKYLQVMKTLGPKSESTKQLSSNWEKAWMDSGVKQIEQFGKEWQNMLKASGLESLVQMNKEWEKFWKTPGVEPSTTYADVMRQYSEAWQKMWEK